MDWYNHMTSPVSLRVENLLDFDNTVGQDHETDDLDISWVKDLDRVQPLETCFDLMLDENSYKVNGLQSPYVLNLSLLTVPFSISFIHLFHIVIHLYMSSTPAGRFISLKVFI